jgi:hypothetical protein
LKQAKKVCIVDVDLSTDQLTSLDHLARLGVIVVMSRQVEQLYAAHHERHNPYGHEQQRALVQLKSPLVRIDNYDEAVEAYSDHCHNANAHAHSLSERHNLAHYIGKDPALQIGRLELVKNSCDIIFWLTNVKNFRTSSYLEWSY